MTILPQNANGHNFIDQILICLVFEIGPNRFFAYIQMNSKPKNKIILNLNPFSGCLFWFLYENQYNIYPNRMVRVNDQPSVEYIFFAIHAD